MTYLVTGATGFIGTELVRRLIARGDALYYLARRRSPKLPSQAAFHPWREGEKPDLDALSRIDGVFHLAGEPIAQRWSQEVKKRIYDSRVEGTRNLVTALRELVHRPAVLISASAIGFYGDRGDEVLTEEQEAGTDFLAELCRDWERESLRARELGMRVITVRIAAVLGPGGGVLQKMLPLFRAGLGGKFGTGQQWMSWIHLEDLARLFFFAADTVSLSGAVNGSSPAPITNAEFTKALARAVHRPAWLTVPKFAMKLLLGEMADYLFTSLRVPPRAAEQAGFRFEYPSIEAALESAVRGKHAQLLAERSTGRH